MVITVLLSLFLMLGSIVLDKQDHGLDKWYRFSLELHILVIVFQGFSFVLIVSGIRRYSIL